MEFSFAQASQALALSVGVSAERRGAFISRLQHLKRLKFPPGTNTGRGQAVRYGPSHLFQIGLVLELGQVGLTPERAVHILTEDWEVVAQAAIAVGEDGRNDRGSGAPVVLYCDPAAVTTALGDQRDDEAQVTFMVWRLDEALEWLGKDLAAGAHRAAIFSASALCRSIGDHACDSNDLDNFYSSLCAWGKSQLAKKGITDGHS